MVASPTATPPDVPAETDHEQGTLLNLALRNTLRIAAGLAVLIAACAAVLLLAGGPSYGSDKPVKRGDTCTQIGEERKDRSGDVYVCKQKPEDSCPRFHAKHPGGGGQPLPPCVCPSKSPSASASVSPSASKSPSSSASPSQSASTSASPSKPASPTKSATVAASPAKPNASPSNVAVTLPVTGQSNTLLLLSIAAVAVGAGLGLLTFAGSRRRRTA